MAAITRLPNSNSTRRKLPEANVPAAKRRESPGRKGVITRPFFQENDNKKQRVS